MAAGDLTLFNQFGEDEGEEIHNLGADTIKVALIKSAANSGYDPTAATSNPCWGAGGTTNLSSYEVTAGGNYTSGGSSLSGVTWSRSGGTTTLDDSGNVSISQHASNPTNARWAIIYNDTATNKNCIGYVDLGEDKDLSSGNFSITWNASGIATKTVNA